MQGLASVFKTHKTVVEQDVVQRVAVEGNIICAVQQTRLCAITGVLSDAAGLKRAG